MMNQNDYGKQQGQSVILVAFLFLGLLLFAAIAVDMSSAYARRRAAQAAADAAALAGAAELGRCINEEGGANDNTVKMAINDFSQRNQVEDTDSTDAAINGNVLGYYLDAAGNPIEKFPIGSWPGSKPPKEALGVEVTVFVTAPSFFGGILGYDKYDLEAEAAVLFESACMGDCVLPIAIHSGLDSYPYGFQAGKCYNLWDGDEAGNFGWLNWSTQGTSCMPVTDDCSADCLDINLNPDTCLSGVLTVGTVVGGMPGVKNANMVRHWLDYYVGTIAGDYVPVRIVVYDTIEGKLGGCGKATFDGSEWVWNGKQGYLIAGFAGFRMTGYRLSSGGGAVEYDLPCYYDPDYPCFDTEGVYMADPLECVDFPKAPSPEELETGEVNRITGIFRLEITSDTYNCKAIGNLRKPCLTR